MIEKPKRPQVDPATWNRFKKAARDKGYSTQGALRWVLRAAMVRWPVDGQGETHGR